MARVANLVLYARPRAYSKKDGGNIIAGERRPLASKSADNPTAAMVIGHALSAELSRAKDAGEVTPEIKLIRETRDADSDGRLTHSRFVECDLTTLQPKKGDDGAASLDELFAVKKGA